MPIALENPWWLAVVPPIALWLWWIDKDSFTDLPVNTRRAVLAVRLVTVLLLAVALAGARYTRSNLTLNVIFVADASSSVGSDALQKELAFVRTAFRSHIAGDSAALLYFGANTNEAVPITPHLPATPPLPDVDPTATNIQTALQQAADLLKSKPGGRRIVLLSDGNENEGEALSQAYDLTASKIAVDTVPISQPAAQEALVRSLTLPRNVKIGQPFNVEALLESTVPQTASVTLIRNGSVAVSAMQVALRTGITRVSLQQTLHQPGAYRYTLLMHAPYDTLPENNRGTGYIWVRGKPRVLYVADSAALTSFLRSTMQHHQIDVQYLPPADLPSSAADLQAYDAVFLSNVSATELSQAQMRALQLACRDLGIGLGMVGGDNSFGAGYYRGTPVEAALPVNMDIKAQKKLPSVAVALVMEDLELPSAVNISIQAAKAVVGLLEPIDQVGVLDCNGFGFGGTQNATASGRWRIPMQHVTNSAALQSQMQDLTDMGDPPTYDPYLLEAARVLNGTNAAVKHIVFLGDGDAIFEGDQNQLASILKQITGMGITVSTIASGADLQGQQFLQYMADTGHGSAFVANQPDELPRLLLKDAEHITQPPVVTKPTIAHETLGDTVLRGVPWSTAPPLLGYNIVTPKPTATIALTDASPGRNNALFAWQQYGLGRSLAFMSDDRAKWAALWLRWPGYAAFWAQAIRWILRPNPPGYLHAVLTKRGTRGEIDVSAISAAGQFINNLTITAVVSPPGGGKTEQLHLTQSAPGKYIGSFLVAHDGTYLVAASAAGKNRTPGTVVSGLSVAYPAEYRTIHSHPELLQQLAAATGGRFTVSPSAVYGADRPSSQHETSITEMLLMAVLPLFLVDVALRRVSFRRFNRREFTASETAIVPTARETERQYSGRTDIAPAALSGISRLTRAKERARQQFSNGTSGDDNSDGTDD